MAPYSSLKVSLAQKNYGLASELSKAASMIFTGIQPVSSWENSRGFEGSLRLRICLADNNGHGRKARKSLSFKKVPLTAFFLSLSLDEKSPAIVVDSLLRCLSETTLSNRAPPGHRSGWVLGIQGSGQSFRRQQFPAGKSSWSKLCTRRRLSNHWLKVTKGFSFTLTSLPKL